MPEEKEIDVATVTVRIPEALLKRAQATTGRRDEREGKISRFKTAKDASAHLKRV